MEHRRQLLAGLLAGLLLCFGFISILSIGLPFFVIGLGLALRVALKRRLRSWSALWGITAGIAFVLLLIGVIHLGDNPCQGDSVSVTLPDEEGKTEWECGGFDPVPWFVAGGWLGAVSWLGFRLTRHR